MLSKKDKWVSTKEFDYAKYKMKRNCSVESFNEFMTFLKNYKGGYVRRKNGKIVSQDYLGKEKGDLKGVFFNIIVPNPNLSVGNKEEFRNFLKSIGVYGVDTRPEYEIRDSKLKNKEKDEDAFQRKEVGNKGERYVRLELSRLYKGDFSVINGPVLKSGETVKEFDHIVVGITGVFVIETKAFGMTDGKASKAALFVDKGDKWIIRKNGKNREIVSPTEQVMAEKKQLEDIIAMPIEVHPVLVLSNSELFVKQNIPLPYDVVKKNDLKDFIENYKDKVSVNDKLLVLQNLDKSRVN